MHAALQIEEVFVRIADALDQNTPKARSALYALARTCRTFHEPAINVLWHTQTSLVPILRCIPAQADVQTFNRGFQRRVQVPKKQFRIDRPTGEGDNSDWQPFNKYASKIKRFQWPFLAHREVSALIGSGVFKALRENTTRPLFPQLRLLQWPITGVQFEDESSVSLFFGPKLLEFNLRTANLDHYIQTLERMEDDCSSLRNFSFTCEPTPALKGLFQGWTSLRSLRCSTFPDSPRMWGLPSFLPNLETLSLGVTPTNSSPSRDEELGIRPYLSLRRFNLTVINQAIENINSLLSMQSFPQLEILTIAICTNIRHTEGFTQALFETIARVCSPRHFRELEITLGDGYGTNQRSDNRVIHSSVLRPLLTFPNMRRLCLGAFSFLDMGDELLQDMAQAWRSIVSLRLEPDRRRGVRQSQVTLRSLEYLSQYCPRLEEFGAVVSAVAIPELPPSEPTEPCNLVSLFLVDSDITSPPDAVAGYLSRLFPRLVCISATWVDGDHQNRWGEVQGLVRELRKQNQ